jgi:hypothetical protein
MIDVLSSLYGNHEHERIVNIYGGFQEILLDTSMTCIMHSHNKVTLLIKDKDPLLVVINTAKTFFSFLSKLTLLRLGCWFEQ